MNIRFHVCGQIVATSILFLTLTACNKKYDNDQSSAMSSVATTLDDSMISTKVREALLANPEVKSLAIKVKTDDGSVVLSGFVNNQHQIDLSMNLAAGIRDVKSVSNELSIKDNSTAAVEKIPDDWVTTAVKTALFNDSKLKSFDISVVTRHGQVMLSGFVNNDAQSMHSVDVAQAVEGVNSVLNHITVKPN